MFKIHDTGMLRFPFSHVLNCPIDKYFDDLRFETIYYAIFQNHYNCKLNTLCTKSYYAKI